MSFDIRGRLARLEAVAKTSVEDVRALIDTVLKPLLMDPETRREAMNTYLESVGIETPAEQFEERIEDL